MECVGSNAKKKTTMAKRNRENALRDDDYWSRPKRTQRSRRPQIAGGVRSTRPRPTAPSRRPAPACRREIPRLGAAMVRRHRWITRTRPDEARERWAVARSLLAISHSKGGGIGRRAKDQRRDDRIETVVLPRILRGDDLVARPAAVTRARNRRAICSPGSVSTSSATASG